MHGPERRFWRKVREAWTGHSCRIEASDGEAGVGTPDTVLSVGGRGGWVELKVWPDNVSAEQLAWAIDARRRGAYAVVLCQLRGDSVWLGSAEEYQALIRARTRPEGVVLQTALNMIACALTGRSA